MAADDFRFAKAVGVRGHVLVFIADERPELPALQAVAVPQMEKRIKIIVGDDVPFPRLAVNGKQDEENFVAKQPVLEVAVKRKKRGVIFIRVRRALLKIEREKREAFCGEIIRVLAAGKTEQLAELPAIFHSITLISQHRIKQIKFL